MKFEDILYKKESQIAWITINRPQKRNAFRPLTVKEMIFALEDAIEDLDIGVIVLSGQGKEAFCSGGDQSVRGDEGYKDLDGKESLNVLKFQKIHKQSAIDQIFLKAPHLKAKHSLETIYSVLILSRAQFRKQINGDQPKKHKNTSPNL